MAVNYFIFTPYITFISVKLYVQKCKSRRCICTHSPRKTSHCLWILAWYKLACLFKKLNDEATKKTLFYGQWDLPRSGHSFSKIKISAKFSLTLAKMAILLGFSKLEKKKKKKKSPKMENLGRSDPLNRVFFLHGHANFN